MNKSELLEIKKDNIGTGLLIENDGYISMSDIKNRQIKEAFDKSDSWYCPSPFIVHAVFQKYGIKNANGRIYPEEVLKKQVELYQQRIAENRALGECYSSDALIFTSNGWKSIIDVKEGDIVLTLNTKTNSIEPNPIINKIEYEYNGDMVRLTSHNMDDLITPNHKFPVFNNEMEFKKFYTAEEILNSDNCDGIIVKMNKDNEIVKATSINKKYMKCSLESYSGKVYCIDVNNHTWYVKQNGYCHWTGNCNHPSESTISLDRVSHNIKELHWEGRTLVGQLELNLSPGYVKHGIVSTMGDMIANLLLNGYKIGVSSRGIGSVEQKMGQYIVGDDFELICWDIVSDPSTPNAYISQNHEDLSQYVEEKKYKNNIINEKINKIKNILQ